jgi:hypothetical protein
LAESWNQGKTSGNPKEKPLEIQLSWETHGKTMGKPWENHGKLKILLFGREISDIGSF